MLVLDFAGDAVHALLADAPVRAELGSSAERVSAGYSGPDAETGGWRVSIVLDPAGALAADLRCALRGEQGPLAETWLYRWTA